MGGRRRAVSPPPARPQGRGCCQGDGVCSPEGTRPLPRPVHLRRPAPATPRLGERRKGRGAADGPPTHLRARAATPGGQRHPEPPQPLLPPPPEAPFRKRDHWSEAATLPDMVPPSAPPTSPFPHARLPSRCNCGTEVRLLGSDARSETAPRWCLRLKCPTRKIGFRELVPNPKTTGAGYSPHSITRKCLPPAHQPHSGSLQTAVAREPAHLTGGEACLPGQWPFTGDILITQANEPHPYPCPSIACIPIITVESEQVRNLCPNFHI